eukprot:c1426_g1_i1 orf=63-1418(+)
MAMAARDFLTGSLLTWRPMLLPPSASSISTLRAFPTSRQLHLSIVPAASPTQKMVASTTSPTQKKVLVPIAFGSEEIEVVVIVDILRRAGADVLVASVEDDLQTELSRRVKLVADTHISSCDEKDFDLIALPGGMPGSARLQGCQLLKKMIIDQADEEKLVGAISMSPALALQEWGVLHARQVTCHPGFVDKMSPTFITNARVQTDGCVTTSQGPGTAFDFALSFVEQLYGEEKYKEVLEPLVLGSRSRQESSKNEFNSQNWKATGNPRVLVPIANGSEEMEAIIIIDVLRRANMNIVVASVEQDLQIEASRRVKIVADKHIEDVEDVDYDIIVLPGGMPGAERLRDCATLQRILRKQVKDRRPVGAICAAPAVILEANGWLKGKKATCHPAFVKKLSSKRVAKSRVVIDGYHITSQGPGTAIEFALCIVEKFFGKDRALNIARALVFEYF